MGHSARMPAAALAACAASAAMRSFATVSLGLLKMSLVAEGPEIDLPHPPHTTCETPREVAREAKPWSPLKAVTSLKSAQVPLKQWAAVDGFDLQDQVLDIVDSGVVEPAALPRASDGDGTPWPFKLRCAGEGRVATEVARDKALAPRAERERSPREEAWRRHRGHHIQK